MQIKVSDYIFDYLVKNTGVDTVFMLPGGGCMHLVDSLGKTPGLSYVCNLHEQASAIAADAAGQYTGNLGLALVTAGPGSADAAAAPEPSTDQNPNPSRMNGLTNAFAAARSNVCLQESQFSFFPGRRCATQPTRMPSICGTQYSTSEKQREWVCS